MKKLEVCDLENLERWESKVFNFFKNLDLENISKLTISTEIAVGKNYTFFSFKTKANETIHFFYERNQKIFSVKIWEGRVHFGDIQMRRYENNKKRGEWINSIWEQFVDYFNLRIRLMFISETAPWRWNTEFTY